ncbi:MAG: SdrD B-like domain-containing protein [Armatimonadota bacterium]
MRATTAGNGSNRRGPVGLKALGSVLCFGAAIAAAALSGARPSHGEHHLDYVGFPSLKVDDGKFLSLAGKNRSTLNQAIELRISIPAGADTFEVGIFDGESSGRWDAMAVSGFQPVPLQYTLCADPEGDGSGQAVVATWNGSTMVDNGWWTATVPTNPAAQAPSGNYFYKLVVTLPSFPGDVSMQTRADWTWSNFKVRTDGNIAVRPSSFSFCGPVFLQEDREAIYPNWNAHPTDAAIKLANSTYSGEWDVFLDVPANSSALEIWDGDFDYGSAPGFPAAVDTDDPNTQGAPFVPAWAAGTPAVAEGAAGAVPNDDNSSVVFRRSPAIEYSVITPAGVSYRNANPSGNLEWERFRLDTAATFDPTVADYKVSSLPAGIYRVAASGVDLNNLNAWRTFHYALGVDEDGVPKPPIRTQKLSGTVWFDADTDKSIDGGESGIGAVTVVLKDLQGQVVSSTQTSAAGTYEFQVEPGDYVVCVAPSNHNAGAPLEELLITTDNFELNVTVADDNVYGVNFGYVDSANGTIGDAVWLDSDKDGNFEPQAGELGAHGATVVLTVDKNGDGTADYTATTTTVNGLYLFEKVPGGTYTVSVSGVPASWAPYADKDGVATPNTATSTIANGGVVDLTADFSYGPAVLLGTGTQGYWKTHPEAWPVESITIGGVTYTKAQAIAIMQVDSKDNSYSVAQQLIAAKLNVGVGNNSSEVEGYIVAADNWLKSYAIGSNPKGSAWSQVQTAHDKLDAYNNGLLGAPHRDSLGGGGTGGGGKGKGKK